MPLESLSIEHLSDREFLLIVADVTDEDGWSDSIHVAEQLGMKERRSAAIRLSWLARFGAVEREHERDEAGNLRWRRGGKPMYTQRWRMTPIGEQLAAGKLGKRQADSLEKLDDVQMLQVTRWLTDRARHANPTVTKLVSREWRYGTSALRNGRVR